MPPTIQHLIDQWLTEASTLRAQAHTLRADCMYETARRLRIQADQLVDCATQLTSVAQLNQPASITPANQEAAQAAMDQVRSKEQELLRPLRQRAAITQTTPEDQMGHAPAQTSASPQKSARRHSVANSNASHKAALEQSHGELQARLEQPATPHGSQPPSAGAPPETSAHQTSAASPLSPPCATQPAPHPAHASTPLSAPTQSPPWPRNEGHHAAQAAHNAAAVIPPQTKAEDHSSSSPDSDAAP